MIRASDAGKEVGGAEGKELAENFAYGLPLEQRGYNPAQDVFNREAASPNLSSREKFLRILGRVCAVVVILIVLGVALGLGLGLGLNSKQYAWTNINREIKWQLTFRSIATRRQSLRRHLQPLPIRSLQPCQT